MRLWGGRFEGGTDDLMRQFNDSFGFDRRLYAADIRGSVAYAGALHRAGLLTEEEHAQIVAGLEQVRQEFEAGTVEPQPRDEGIHATDERHLTENGGPGAGKAHNRRTQKRK